MINKKSKIADKTNKYLRIKTLYRKIYIKKKRPTNLMKAREKVMNRPNKVNMPKDLSFYSSSWVSIVNEL